ncbi:magnesium transporter NIPA-domain-containing protein [Podospora conica]|nr:magnesium transporter NIPA-domain-containing protein [Schizothecium conicum]
MFLPMPGPPAWRADTFRLATQQLPTGWTRHWPVGSSDGHGHPGDDLQNWSSLIGITTAICGNVLIALALNVQRYAHIRLHRQKAQVRERAKQALRNARGAQTRGGSYGTTGSSDQVNGSTPRAETGRQSDETGDSNETEPLTGSFGSGDSGWTEGSEEDEQKAPSTYLKDPYWWLGQVLITVGEMGNFLAYGFAPASIVSPLGVVALVSNCVIAPIFFKEVFRTRDFWGVIIAIGGAVTVVLSAKGEETKLGPHEVWDAITTTAFEIYMGVSCSLIVLLMWLSPRYGNRTILIDLGLVGLFGGYTALSTKGVSSMLSSTLLGAFATPVTYALIFVLLSTAIMQVRYLNKALARFDSTQVIPIQFVSFTLSVIIGSAILYRDFERTTSEQAAKFIGGCFLTFFGVFLITSDRPRHDEDEETLSDAEGIEETIGLAEQGNGGPQTPRQQRTRRGSASTSSRRSSRVMHINYKDSINKPLAALTGTGFPTLRVPTGSSPSAKSPLAEAFEEDEADAPLAWSAPADQHPGAGSRMLSSDSIPSVTSLQSDEQQYGDGGTLLHQVQTMPSSSDLDPRPVTPTGTDHAPLSRPYSHPHHFGAPMISPSPFSSTLSAVVADKLLSHMESPTQRRGTGKRSRVGLRNSLFMPQDEVEEEEEDGGASSAGEGRARLFDDEVLPPAAEEDRTWVRGRARSLSHTLGELLGVRLSRRNTEEGMGEGEGLLAAERREGGRSSDTL